ncbi:MAG: phage portal protein family protein [Candidatus Hydrogenedens sp.]
MIRGIFSDYRWRNWFRIFFSSRENSKMRSRSVLRRSLVFNAPNGYLQGFVPLPDNVPFQMLEVYRYLRDNIPDLSDAVWTWKRLCNTGFRLSWSERVSESLKRDGQVIIEQLNRRMNHGEGGLTHLLDILYTSLFTYGASAIEIVFSPRGSQIYDVVPVDVWTVRFRWEDGDWQAYQVYAEEVIRLPRERFVYIALDRDGTNPYGRSLFRSLPFVVRIQQRLMEDMSRAMHNAGWARMHVQYKPEPRGTDETEEEYQSRLDANLEQVRNQMSNLGVDQNVVTFDNIGISVVQGAQRFSAYYETQRAIEEQIITGAHMMPILLGRNYGTTETYGTVQYEIMNRQVDTINQYLARVLERIYRLELSMHGIEAEFTVQPQSNSTADTVKKSLIETRRINTLLQLVQSGIISKEDVRKEVEEILH